MTARLSVIVPAYNAKRTLVRCLESIKRDLPADAELIVVDDASTDGTGALAKPLSDQVIVRETNKGDFAARTNGASIAKGDIFLFVDSDVVIPSGTCAQVLAAFDSDPDLAALTGRLSADVQPGFFTDYKNLYMNYIFGRLPDQVTFLYGSVFAVRAEQARSADMLRVKIGSDTAYGQALFLQGKKIRFLRDLEVMHLKVHTLGSFYRNDFSIPYGWATVFRRFRGWQQLGRGGTGFAHSSKTQLLSLMVAWIAVLLALAAALGYRSVGLCVAAALAWAALNAPFLAFLFQRRGVWYGVRAIPVTFVDHLVMATGAGAGLINAYTKDIDGQ